MHMADALLSPAVGGTFYAATGGLLALAARQVVRAPDYERRMPLMGVLGAFVFAAQMINFAIPGTGSSGHLGGGLLLAVLLGPWAAFLVIASVLVIQCLFFMDGGLLALGCNVFNMGFWPAFVGLWLYRRLARFPTAAAVAAAAVALEMGALGVVLQTLLSGRSDLTIGSFCALMLGIHLPIGIVEGFVTAGVIRLAAGIIPNSEFQIPNRGPVQESAGKGREYKFGIWHSTFGIRRLAFGIRHADGAAMLAATLAGLALFVGMIGVWFASPRPDGLEWSVERIAGREAQPAAAGGVAAAATRLQKRTALMPDYRFPSPAGRGAGKSGAGKWPAVDAGTSVAGFVGAGLTALLIVLLSLALRWWRRRLGNMVKGWMADGR